MSAATLSAEAIGLRIGAATLLDGVSLRLAPGSFTAVLGRNGAGKSTLLRVLSGTLAPTSGTLRLDGAPMARIGAPALARRRAVLSQHHALAFDLSVGEVVALGRAPHRRTPAAAWDRQALAEIAARFGLAPLWARAYPSLSGGERQRVQLARAAAQLWRPDGDYTGQLLFLDEPAAALDLAQQAVALEFAFAMAARGAAVLAVLHDPNHARRADQVLLLRHGRVQTLGPAATALSAATLAACLGVTLRTLRDETGAVCFVP